MTEGPKQSRTKQAADRSTGQLFGAERPIDMAPVVVLSSNFTIGPLFARGCLLPEALEGEVLSNPHKYTLTWSNGVVPRDSVDALANSARNVIPIGIRLAPTRVVRSIQIGSSPHQVECIHVSDVGELCFRNEKEQSRFESLELANYDLAATGVRSRTDSALFEGAAPTTIRNAASGVGQVAVAVTASLTSAIRAIDCRLGLLALLLSGSPGWRIWMEEVEQLFRKRPRSTRPVSWVDRIIAAAVTPLQRPSDAESAFLASAFEVVARYPLETGWPADQILAEIRVAATDRLASDDERARRELQLWAERASDVLASKAEPQSMADEAFIAQRAILLLLLRGDLDAIAEGKTSGSVSTIRPGPRVSGTASALAAFRTGLRALPSRFKVCSDQSAPGRLLDYLGEAFLQALTEATPASVVPKGAPTPDINYRAIRTLQGEWITTVSGKEITRTPAEFDRGLERLLTMGRHLGFEFEEHGYQGLASQLTLPSGRRRPVYLELLQSDRSGTAVVRFSSPTLKLVGAYARSRLPKEFLLDLLLRNARPDVNCRFAILDDASEIVVLVDQLLSTIDEAEFKQHIEHVAQVAEDFELSRDIGKVSSS